MLFLYIALFHTYIHIWELPGTTVIGISWPQQFEDQTSNHCSTLHQLIIQPWVLSCGLTVEDYIYKGKVHLWRISRLWALIKEQLLFINRVEGIKEILDLSIAPYLTVPSESKEKRGNGVVPVCHPANTISLMPMLDFEWNLRDYCVYLV